MTHVKENEQLKIGSGFRKGLQMKDILAAERLTAVDFCQSKNGIQQKH